MRVLPTFIAAAMLTVAACGSDAPREVTSNYVSGGGPSSSQVPLDPLTIPKFAHELPIPRTFAPTVITAAGQVIRNEYTVSVKQTAVQMLPPGFPGTTVLAYGGEVTIPGSMATEFVRTVPGPTFENTRGIPTLMKWRNEIDTTHFMPVDPTLHFANPLAMEPPTAPFIAFPPGYTNAQNTIAHVTHMHGLMVGSGHDGVAEQWFTMSGIVGPNYVTRDYLMPNDQPATHLFYHDHTMGMTRLGVYAGMVGAGYFIRDPNSPLDQPSSTLPSGAYEIPLVILDRAFFTDGELSFPRVSTNPGNAYWQAGDGANTVLVNGKVWPNLNVERRQYRFRVLTAGNGRTWNVQLDNGGVQVPFTIIGSDGGYLPAPQVVTNVTLGMTERADILVDFSQFPAGTQITMINAGANLATVGTIMRFTVQSTTPVAPPAIAALPARTTLVADAPRRIKTFHNITDAAGNSSRATDGLDYSAPALEYALVGSTEEWDVINIGGGGHLIHLHLIEFQVVSRQNINAAAYLQQWRLLNGHRPVTRPIVVDPTPYLIGSPVPPLPYEAGWKDTVRSGANQVVRIIARWAPQELATNAVTAGQNLFSIDPTVGPGYVWHCHVLGHEDFDMMRPLHIVRLWAPATAYTLGTVMTYQNVNYRVRVPHTSLAAQPPPTRFDRYERVNNNDGTWQPQIIYAIGDRVLHNGVLYMASALHQAGATDTPDTSPALWHTFPMNACGQLSELCHGGTTLEATECHDVGHEGIESACLTELPTCLAACSGNGEHGAHGGHASPCSGLCTPPIAFSVPDGTTYESLALGTAASCHETTSEITTGQCQSFAAGRNLTVNGRVMPCNGGGWGTPIPTQRNHGYCIQTNMGNSPNARFTVE
jgi:spore coat protein A